MADEPIEQLGNATPMEKANKPAMDALAKNGEVGMVKTVAEGLKPGSDVANLSVLGYEPAVYYSGRSPLEAASIGIELEDTDVTLRCNLVTLSDEEGYENKTMVDYCAGDISTEEARVLIEYIDEQLGSDEFKFYSGVAYRHCLVWRNGCPHPGELTPPHDISGQPVKNHLPSGERAAVLYELMKKSNELLIRHPINKKRIAEGKRPANSVWLWGEGTKPRLDGFYERFGKRGSMISAVDLLKGIAICTGMKSVDVEGATGYIDTDFDGKCAAAIDEFKNGADLVYVHVEAPDECGHRGEVENKVRSIELIDSHILAPVTRYLREQGDFAVLVCPDHPTPLSIKTHTSDPVPYLIYNSRRKTDSKVSCFCEKQAKETGNYISKGFTLMNYFLSL